MTITIFREFDFLLANKEKNYLDNEYSHYLRTFLDICARYKSSYDVISSFLVLSILMNVYFSRSHRMLVLKSSFADKYWRSTNFFSEIVFNSLYKHHVIKVIEMSSHIKSFSLDISHKIETYLELFLLQIKQDKISSSHFHMKNIQSQHLVWDLMKSNTFCICCIRHSLKWRKSCDHAICDICVRRFDICFSSTKNRYLIKNCIFCDNDSLIVNLKSKIVNIRVLIIDDDETRDIISLEYLRLLEKLLDDCLLH